MYTSIHLMLLSTCTILGIYGIGYTLNKLTMGFLFWGDKVTVISVYYYYFIIFLQICVYSHALCFENYLAE